MRTSLLLSIALLGFGCGDDGNKAVDAPPPMIDAAPPMIDATPPLALNCATYCSSINTTCTGAAAQYADPATSMNCAQTCAKFPVGTSADTSMDTLGCRLYHIQNITVRNMAAATHCLHAGPAGASVPLIPPATTADSHCSDACTNFCTLEQSVCGFTGANAQYADMGACMTACGNFDKTVQYSAATTTGNTLACRLYHLTNAAIDANTAAHCPHTAVAQVGTNPFPCK